LTYYLAPAIRGNIVDILKRAEGRGEYYPDGRDAIRLSYRDYAQIGELLERQTNQYSG
jgi:hypothetical protein